MWWQPKQVPDNGFVFSRLRDALEKEGCPLCFLTEQESEHRLDMLFYEGLMDAAFASVWLRPGVLQLARLDGCELLVSSDRHCDSLPAFAGGETEQTSRAASRTCRLRPQTQLEVRP